MKLNPIESHVTWLMFSIRMEFSGRIRSVDPSAA